MRDYRLTTTRARPTSARPTMLARRPLPIATLLSLLATCLTACGDDGAGPVDDGGVSGDGAVASDGSPDGSASDGGTDAAAGSCGAPADPPCDGIAEVPEPLNEHVAAYFEGTQEMVVFGGNTAVPVNCGFPDWVYHDTTWIFYDYENECGQWTRVEGTAPPARGRHAAAQSDDTMWIFGGRFREAGSSGLAPYTLRDQLWAFDVNSRSWTELAADGTSPQGRYNTTLAYDSQEGRLWLYAGNGSTSGASPVVLDDLWSYDLEAGTWTAVEPTGQGPEPRMWHNMIYDPERHRLVVFGGGDEGAFQVDATYFNDVWALDLETESWELLHDGTGTAPVGRFWASLTYDATNDRYLVFGGHDATSLGNRNDLWSFDPEAGTWTELVTGDTFNAPANGFCDFPPDFATIDHDSPERRNAHSLVYSETCGHAILFGGKTDCGAINDVWRYDGEWQPEFTSGQGEVCARARGSVDECESMCF